MQKVAVGIIGPGLVGSALLSQIVAQVGVHEGCMALGMAQLSLSTHGAAAAPCQAACIAQRAFAWVAGHSYLWGWQQLHLWVSWPATVACS